MRGFAVAILLSLPVAASAQWHLNLSAGTLNSRGETQAADPGDPVIRPSTAHTYALGVAREYGPWQIGIEGSILRSNLEAAGGGVSAVSPPQIRAWTIAGTASRRIVGGAQGSSLRAGIALGMTRWEFRPSSSPKRSRPTAGGTLTLDTPFSRAFSLLVTGRVDAAPSIFNAEDMPEGYQRRTSLRYGLLVGLDAGW